MVGHDAIGEQGVCRVFFYCLFPEFGNGIDGHGFFIAFQIDVMSAGLGGICVSPLVGIYGVFREEIDVRFIEFEQGLRQGENGLFVDGFVSQKSPSLQVMNREQQKQQYGYGFSATRSCVFGAVHDARSGLNDGVLWRVLGI
jgi:hypothetical protein